MEEILDAILFSFERFWYLYILLILSIVFTIIVNRDEKMYYKKTKKKMTNIEASKKIMVEENIRTCIIVLVVLIGILIFFHYNDFTYQSFYRNMGKIVEYASVFLLLVCILTVVFKRDDNELIKKYLQKCYDCTECSDGYNIRLNKGYIGVLLPDLDKKNFIETIVYRRVKRIHFKYNICARFSIRKNNSKKYNNSILSNIQNELQTSENNYYNEKLENFLNENKQMKFYINIDEYQIKISAFATIDREDYKPDRFSMFFYIVESFIKIANIIIEDDI